MSGRIDKRKLPKSPEHRAKIAEGNRRAYAEGRRKPANKGGEESYNWKGGIRTTYYRRIAFAAHGGQCQRCGKSECTLDVHHVDKNRRNNKPQNLEVLCKSCHQKYHWHANGRTHIPGRWEKK